MNRALTVIGVAVVAVGIVAFSTMFTVHQTEQALVLQFGEPIRVIREPGLKFKIPFAQNVVTFDRRVLDLDPEAEEIIAADAKRVVADSYTRYRIVDPLKFYQTTGNEAGLQVRLGRMVNSAMRAVVGRFPLSALLTEQRVRIMAEIQQRVNREAQQFGIELVDVRIRRADLPQANSEAIYARMRSEREREAKEFRAQGAEAADRIRAEADRDRTILLAEARQKAEELRGEGDGEAQAIYNTAYGGEATEFYEFYRRMQAFKETFASGDASLVLSPDSEFFRYFSDFPGARAKPAR
ncbi:MAG TPA: protease modulator HflC [Alphaproteobacteria bacterium]|jgi:membrane protease subunit HflC